MNLIQKLPSLKEINHNGYCFHCNNNHECFSCPFMDKLIKRTRRSAMDLIKVPKESLPICGDCGGIMLIRKKKKKGTKNSKKSAYYCPCCDNKY